MINILNKKRKKITHFNKKEIPNLNYGMIHCRFGDPEGVSIVMQQLEDTLNQYLNIPKKNIKYLIGISKTKSSRITEKEILHDQNKINLLAQKKYKEGFTKEDIKKIEIAINKAKKAIEKWINKNKIDVLIAHNSSHPVNFISSVAISRYYKESIKKNKKTPKYILWWHDSHLERESFIDPAKNVEEYIIEGIQGPYVEHILFINKTQFNLAKRYFKKIDEKYPGFYKNIKANHDVIYNTTELFIKNHKELESNKFIGLVNQFITDFNIKELFEKENLEFSEVLFVLQPTRIVQRKRIDFALKYCYELLKSINKEYKAIYFLISGHSADKTKEELIKLNKKLKEKYDINKLFLVFAEDYYSKTKLKFEDYPKVFAKLNGIATYFSEIEGFGNNLLEVLAAGLIPIIYKYPVYKSDIAQFRFNLISLDKYEITKKNIKETIELINNKQKKQKWIDKNLIILKKNLSHKTMNNKLIKAITSKRLHI